MKACSRPILVGAPALTGALFLFLYPSLSQAEGDSSYVIEEVIVTARKRDESLQDVPVAVSAFSMESMEALGIKNLRDFDGIVPSLNMGGGGNGAKGDSNPYIRGVGQRETKVTIDTAVGTYLDGVYLGRASGAMVDMVDVESIQILRGPQGTLFGKNTTGGAIVINTSKPHETFGGQLKLGYGNFGRREGSLIVNAPLLDQRLYSRLTVAGIKTDGYTENTLDSTNWTDDNRRMVLGQLRWLPSDTVTTDFLLSYTRTKQKARSQKCNWLGDELAAQGINMNPLSLESIYNIFSPETVEETCKQSGEDLPLDQFQSEENDASAIFRQAVYDVENSMAAATVAWEMSDGLELKSITAYRNTQQQADEDFDAQAGAITARVMPRHNNTDQYSQEFQLIGDAFSSKLNYTVGLYGFYEKTRDDWLQDYAAYSEFTTVPNSILLARSELTSRETQNTAYAGFGQMDYDFTEQWTLTLGLRYTWEERKTAYSEADVFLPSIGNGQYLGSANSIGVNVLHPFSEPGGRPHRDWQYGYDADGSGDIDPDEVGLSSNEEDQRSDSAWNPMASVRYIASERVLNALNMDAAMTYFTYSSGFRSGGVTVANGDFNQDGNKDLENFKPENLNSYELGFKVDALERRLRANVALFYNDFTDIQVTTVVPDPTAFNLPLPAIENAGKAVIKGVEGEFTFLATSNLRFNASFAYTDADYKEYIADVNNPNPGPGQPITITIDRADEPMPRVPEWTGYLSADYLISTSSLGDITPMVLARYTSEIYNGFDREGFVVADELTSGAQTFYDARLTWQLPDKRTVLTLWGKNLSDVDDYYVGGIPLVSVTRSAGMIYAPRRTYGLEFTYQFGQF